MKFYSWETSIFIIHCTLQKRIVKITSNLREGSPVLHRVYICTQQAKVEWSHQAAQPCLHISGLHQYNWKQWERFMVDLCCLLNYPAILHSGLVEYYHKWIKNVTSYYNLKMFGICLFRISSAVYGPQTWQECQERLRNPAKGNGFLLPWQPKKGCFYGQIMIVVKSNIAYDDVI